MNSWVLFLENLLSDRAFPAKYGTSKSKISPSAPTMGGSGRYYILMHPKPNTHPSALNFKLLPCPKKKPSCAPDNIEHRIKPVSH